MLLSRPLFSNLNSKLSGFFLVALVVLMYISTCAESDMFVPAFPQMIEFFKTTENKIQLVMSFNLFGLCLASLIVGPLSDSFGRRPVLVIGLSAFLVSSLGCLFSDSFDSILFWRAIQGASASVPMVVGTTLIFDRYSPEKAGQVIGHLNSIITAAIAGAPILGAWLSSRWGWRSSFGVITLIILVSLLVAVFFQAETLQTKQKFKMLQILRDYRSLVSSFKFMGNATLTVMPFACIVVYIANLSVILINHFEISMETASYYQATTMGTFILFSLLSAKTIAKLGLDQTKKVGGLLSGAGVSLLFCTGIFFSHSISWICVSMAFVAGGSAFMAGTFGARAMEVFPDLKGTASSMVNAIRQFLAAFLVGLSEYLFDGTIFPVTLILFGCGVFGGLICLFLYTSSTSYEKTAPVT